jgi:hypothetical protein
MPPFGNTWLTEAINFIIPEHPFHGFSTQFIPPTDLLKLIRTRKRAMEISFSDLVVWYRQIYHFKFYYHINYLGSRIPSIASMTSLRMRKYFFPTFIKY